MANSDTYLEHFNAIERRLREISQLGREKGFTALVEAAARRDPAVRRFQDDLKEFAELRNAIVHERRGGVTIAEPNAWAVEHIAAIAVQILRPPRVDQHFTSKVFTLSDDVPIAQAVSAMHANAFSQVPIYRDGAFKGLLTANTIARWLGANISEDLVSLSETTIQHVLTYTEDRDHVCFVARTTTLAEVHEQFLAREALGKRLDAIVITHDGRRDTTPLGIIVA